MNIKPLSKSLGAEVTGVAANALDEAEAKVLRQAFLDHHLLCIRSEPLSDREFADLARWFGTPQVQLIRKRRSAGCPEVSVLDSTYERAQDKPDDLSRKRLSGWHTDDSYFARPAKATMLQALAIPDAGGQTRFCNTRRAWEELPEERQGVLADLQLVHAYDTPRAKARAETLTVDEAAETPDVTHPLMRTHEDTGQPSLYFNPNRTDHVVGMTREQSDALLDELYAHVTRPHLQYEHQWRVGDILIWDNRCLLHSVNMDFPVGQRRRHQRILLEGEAPR